MKTLKTLFPLGVGLAVVLGSSEAAVYQKGQRVENFTLIDRSNGKPVQLTDFAGKIVVLDWFAWWCPYCQAAAPQLYEGIDQWYSQRNGNPAGIPVVHVGVNLQPNQEAQTQNFVTRAKLDLVLQDFDRAIANRIASGGQPLFAIINGVTNSPTHSPWELLYSRQGYGQTTFPLAEFRAAIDAVKPAAIPAVPPQIESIRFNGSGALVLHVTGTAGVQYRLESSINTHSWNTEKTVVLSAASDSVAIVANDGVSARFYRLVAP